MVGRRLLRDGDLFVDYKVRQLVAAGSVTQVYEVAHARTGRSFALKCLDATGSTEEERARFHAGLKVLMAMRHEGLPPVLDGGLAEGKLWLVQELVAGRFVIKEDTEPHWIKVCGWALPAAQALQAAAGKGLLHGDLSPEAIVLSDDGSPQILGMGGHNLYGFSAEVVRSTPAFRSPEQLAGRPIDQRSDIYSFGLLVYAALAGTGQAPDEVRSFKEVPACPRALGEIVAMCAHPDPEQRFASWEELEGVLRVVALHQIMNPNALQFEGPTSGKRVRDALEEAASPAGEAASPSPDVRDTLASAPHVVLPERSASLTVLEANPDDLEVGAREDQREGDEVDGGATKGSDTEEGVSNTDALPTPRVVGFVNGRSGEVVARHPGRARRARLGGIGFAVIGVVLAFFFAIWEREPAPLVAAPVVIPSVALPEAPPEPESPEPEIAPPQPEPEPERDRKHLARLTTPKMPRPVSAPPEPPFAEEPSPAPVSPPAPVSSAAAEAKRPEDLCGPRCQPE